MPFVLVFKFFVYFPKKYGNSLNFRGYYVESVTIQPVIVKMKTWNAAWILKKRKARGKILNDNRFQPSALYPAIAAGKLEKAKSKGKAYCEQGNRK